VIALWLLLPVVGIAFVAVVAALRSLGDEAVRMQREVRAWSPLQPALAELRDESASARAALRAVRRR
jgi:hypothetical protein